MNRPLTSIGRLLTRVLEAQTRDRQPLPTCSFILAHASAPAARAVRRYTPGHGTSPIRSAFTLAIRLSLQEAKRKRALHGVADVAPYLPISCGSCKTCATRNPTTVVRSGFSRTPMPMWYDGMLFVDGVIAFCSRLAGGRSGGGRSGARAGAGFWRWYQVWWNDLPMKCGDASESWLWDTRNMVCDEGGC